MSEYQYYEFLALDRPLDERQLREVDAVSSRAEVSTTRWVNTYNYGNFRGDATRFVTDYFDAMVYVANWGTRRFSVGLPADRADGEQILLHATGDALSVELVTGKLVVDFCSETEDPSGWEDGSGWMATLAPVRSRLLGGDTRPLYLGWLLGLQMGDLDDGDVEPPVPDGLGDLPADLEALADFLRLDEDLLATAAERSGELADRPEGLTAWVAALPDAEKTALLVEAAHAGDGSVGLQLLRRFRSEVETLDGDAAAGERRTAEEIEAEADRRREARWEEERRKAEAERARRKAEAAERRARHLDRIEAQGDAAWANVDELAGHKRPKQYAQAVVLLGDLRDVARRKGAEKAFAAQLGDLRDRHASKQAFLRRLDEAGLVSEPALLRRLGDVPSRR